MGKKEETQIRQADNKVNLEGVLKELQLEEKNEVINGNVIIQTGENEAHTVSVYANKLTKSGTENRAFKGLQTVMREFVSIASLMKEGKTYEEAVDQATKVRVGNASLGRNEFYTNGEFVSNPQISGNFFNRVEKDFNPRAEFEIECFFEKIRKEIKNDEETGRVIVDAIVPLYGGKVVPMQFVATDEETAEYIEMHYEKNRTGHIWGDIVNTAERKTLKKSGFGKDREDVKVNFTRELVITGGDPDQYDEDSPNAFTVEQIKAALNVRETETLPELLKKSQDKSKGTKSSSAKGSASAPKFDF